MELPDCDKNAQNLRQGPQVVFGRLPALTPLTEKRRSKTNMHRYIPPHKFHTRSSTRMRQLINHGDNVFLQRYFPETGRPRQAVGSGADTGPRSPLPSGIITSQDPRSRRYPPDPRTQTLSQIPRPSHTTSFPSPPFYLTHFLTNPGINLPGRQ